MLVAAVAAIVSGACFATAGVLQQRVARSRPEDESLSPRLLLDLVRQKLWLAGIGFAVLSYGFQALALAFGALALVQPLIVTELIFALPIAARLRGARLGKREWLGAFAVAGGLATAMVSASPRKGQPLAAATGWLWVLGVLGAFVLAAIVTGRRTKGPVRASAYAFAAATVMGTQSALFATTIAHIEQGFMPVVTAWQTYLLVLASIGGLLLIQSAYHAGPLAASMPVMDATEPVVAIGIGIVLFGEHLVQPAWRKGLAALGMGIVLLGIVVLDTSPVTRRLHEQGQRAEPENEDEQVQLRASSR